MVDESSHAPAIAEAPRSARHLLALFAVEDVILLAYLAIAAFLVWRTGEGPIQAECFERIYISAGVLVIACLWARTPRGFGVATRWTLYRVALVGVLLETYGMLRDLLPLIRPDSVDSTLLRIDVAIFGVTPALWLERFNRLPIVEYFAFFYFSYFVICSVYLVAVIWLSKGGTATTEFAVGTLIVFCLGQLGYMAVPATGPIRFLESSFHAPLHGGFFWYCVTSAVQAGSALKDVFPSLHTAVPTWLTLYALRRASKDPRWKWPSRVTAFFAVNIVLSTMVLRWHYAIDVVAGLSLATFAAVLSPRVVRLEEAWRARHGLPQPWIFEAEGAIPGERIFEGQPHDRAKPLAPSMGGAISAR